MKRFVVYGSLRRGMQAHGRLQKPGIRFVKEVRVPGYDLYAVSWFPGILPNPDNKEGVVCELYEVMDEVADNLITNLDYFEGYFPDRPEVSLFLRTQIDVEGEPTMIYVFNKDPARWNDAAEKVASGDWVNKIKETVRA